MAKRNINLDDVTEFGNTISKVKSTAEQLEADVLTQGGFMGFGSRVNVPHDEIHVVAGDSIHSLRAGSDKKVFGQDGGSSIYWVNSLTQVVALKTISFTVSIGGDATEGVSALDKDKVSFKIWAHAVAKLNPASAMTAAQRIGKNTQALVDTITAVSTTALINVSTEMSLEEIISDRIKLSQVASDQVNATLAELGYDLALLTITRLGGDAYEKYVKQSEAEVSRATTTETNKSQIAEKENENERVRREAELQAETDRHVAEQEESATRDVQTAKLDQEEALNLRQHELDVAATERRQVAQEADHKVNLQEATQSRELAEKEAERQASIDLLKTQREAARLEEEQKFELERASAKTVADNERLKKEELAAAERSKDVALVEASTEAEALKTKVDAETDAELTQARAKAEASELVAQAEKVQADATRAKTAATGLAEAEVARATVEVDEQRVAVTRAEGLAQAEIEKAQKSVDVTIQADLAALYEQAPVLVELEKMRVQYAHEQALHQMDVEARIKIFEAIAPGMQFNIIGNGGQMGDIMAQVASFAHGVNILGEQVPAIGAWTNGHSNGNLLGSIQSILPSLMPHLQTIMGEVSPRVFGSLELADVVSRLEGVITGDDDLLSAIGQIKKDASFRTVGNIPVGTIMQMLGVNLGSEQQIEAETAA